MKEIDQRSDGSSKGFKEGSDGWALIFSAFFPFTFRHGSSTCSSINLVPRAFRSIFWGKSPGDGVGSPFLFIWPYGNSHYFQFSTSVITPEVKNEEEDCEVSITPVGCYNENPKKPALPKVFYNEAEPGKPNFGGSLLQWSNYFKADFRSFLCKCAHLARSNKWGYFGVREIGRSKATDHEYWVCTRKNREIREFTQRRRRRQRERNRAYSISFNSYKCWQFFWSWILKDCIKFQEKKKKVVDMCSRPRQNVKLGTFTL